MRAALLYFRSMAVTERIFSTLCIAATCAAALYAQASTTPADRLSESWWAKRHAEILEKNKANPNVGLVLLGDSITQNYEKATLPDENFQPTWQRFYATRGALNLGFSGDRTEHVQWRLDHGEVDGLHPRAVVLLIGTNNTGRGQTAAQTEAGIDAVIARLQQKLPQAPILLLGILPSDVSPEKSAADQEINQYLLRHYEGAPSVAYLDISAIYLKNGKLDAALFYDPRLPQPRKPLHPDTTGQRMMAEAIEPALTQILKDSAKQYLATLTGVNTAIIPVPKLENDLYDWYERHKAVLAAKSNLNPEVVLIGDSITHFWGGMPESKIVNGPKSWDLAFGHVPTLNLGFGWDRTQNVLWRLAHGEFDGLHPKTVVINIGTNNLTGTVNARANTPAEIVEGILAIFDAVHAKSPASKIIVMAVFPRGFSPQSPLRAPIRELNGLLKSALMERPGSTFLDIGNGLLESDGTLPRTMMQDGTHPTDEGYRIWAKALLDAGVR